jgi:hypothetical protein
MKTRLLFLTMLFVLVSCGLYAQQEKSLRIHQVGINFSNLNSFGLHYKTGSEKTLLRLSLLALNTGQNSSWGRSEDSLEVKSSSYGAGFRLGFEKRIPIVTKLNFVWGVEAGINYTYQKQKRNDSYTYYNDYETVDWRIMPVVNLILGVTYTIADHLVVGAEIGPGIQYSYGKSKTTNYTRTVEQTNTGFGFYFSTSSANLTLAYRFGK